LEFSLVFLVDGSDSSEYPNASCDAGDVGPLGQELGMLNIVPFTAENV
jgi:hypothetical protein